MTVYPANRPTRNRMRGLALIELMVAMLLGLVIIGAVTGVMLSNTQGFRTTTSLSQIQNSARLGFEIMARDLRQAGSIPCGNDVAVTNLLSAAQINAPWYLDWESGSNGQLVGFSGNDTLAGLTNRISGTDAISVLYAENSGAVVDTYNSDTHSYSMESAESLSNGDIAFICNATQASIFQSDIADDALSARGSVNIHTQPGGFDRNSVVGRLKSRAWYIGDNGRADEGDRSLYLAEMSIGTDGAPELQLIEIAAGVTDLELMYRLSDTSDFRTAAQIGNQWPLVNAVQISFNLLGQDSNVTVDSDVNDGRLGRSFSSIVALRNRIL